jgi:hypothetical protein
VKLQLDLVLAEEVAKIQVIVLAEEEVVVILEAVEVLLIALEEPEVEDQDICLP